MFINKSLPARKVSSSEALAYHVKHAPLEEQVELKEQSSWRAIRFTDRFMTVGMARILFNKANMYEQASAGIARDLSQIGKAACRQDCPLSLSAKLGDGSREVPRDVFLRAECTTEGCPEDGLRAVDAAYTSMPAAAEAEITVFNTTSISTLKKSL